MFDFGCIGDAGVGRTDIAVRNGTNTGSATSPTDAFFLPVRIYGLGFFRSARLIAGEIQVRVSATNGYNGAGTTAPIDSIVRHNIMSGNQGGPSYSCPSICEANINASGGSGGSGCIFLNNVGC